MKRQLIDEQIDSINLCIKSLGKAVKLLAAEFDLLDERIQILEGSKGYSDSPSDKAYLTKDGGLVDPEL